MEAFATVACPFCGESTEIGVDTSIAAQTFTVDCEVCCRPMEVSVECERGEILAVEVSD